MFFEMAKMMAKIQESLEKQEDLQTQVVVFTFI